MTHPYFFVFSYAYMFVWGHVCMAWCACIDTYKYICSYICTVYLHITHIYIYIYALYMYIHMYNINMHAHCMYTRLLPFSRAVHWSLLSWCWWRPIPSPGARIRSVAGLTLGCCQGGYGKPVINHRGVTRNIRDIYGNMFPRWYVHGIWFFNGRVKTYPSCTLQGCHFLWQISNSGIFHGHVWLPEGISIGVSIGFVFFRWANPTHRKNLQMWISWLFVDTSINDIAVLVRPRGPVVDVWGTD